MGGEATVEQPGDILLDYVSPHGPRMTHLRGLLLMNGMDNLRTWGVYDQYLERLTPENRTLLTSTIATSWVPIETAAIHYETIDKLGIPPSDIDTAGERMADRIAEMFLATPLRAAKTDGIGAFAGVLAKNDKLWERMYQGGACRVTMLGKHDFLLEDMGAPLVRYHVFRDAYLAYMRALANKFEPRAHVRETTASDPLGEYMATRFSWL